MEYKHESGSGKKPMWLLYSLAAIALALAVFGLFKAFAGGPSAGADGNNGGAGGKGPNVTAQGTVNEDGDSKDDKSDEGSDRESGENDDKTAEIASQLPAEEAEVIELADRLAMGYFYDEAIEALSKLEGSEAAKAKIEEISALKDKLVPYEGQYYHVFFHSLIIDTDLAFDNVGHSAEGYNMWMTTQSEFKKMLPLFLENDFVLYDITWMMELDSNGNAQPKPIYLPEGKKPLVISVDDVNYYDYMKTDGFADRLDVDENGRVVTIVKDRDGNERATYDGDVFPILDAFVDEHPEFSFRGSKGIVATTGYAGAFGYRITDLELFSEAEGKAMLDKVQQVAQALRNSGWQICSHSYTHNQYWNKKTITMQEMAYDTGRWKNEIEPYVGYTNIFISPFGVHFTNDEPVFRYLIEEGSFNIYCPVGSRMSTWFDRDVMFQERLNLDGYTMIKHPERVSKFFFDPSLVLDPARPPLD